MVGPARVGSLGGVTAGTLLIGPGVGRIWAEAMSFRTRPERIRGSVVAAVLGNTRTGCQNQRCSLTKHRLDRYANPKPAMFINETPTGPLR